MINNIPNLLNLQDETDKKIIFCLVEPSMCNPPNSPTNIEGIWYFPTEQKLREFRLSKGETGIIWLQELTDTNCKACYGKGNTGKIITQSEITTEQIAGVINSYIDDTPELIPDEIIKLMQLPLNMKRPLDMLISIATKDLSDDKENNWDISMKFAKMIKHDFVIKKTLWCKKCFSPNLREAIEKARREIKFSIN